ncbi:PepSY-associated TM helix domain-containing protein [Mycobacterium sp. smrl_JER01]|uniref:PepSY-associated TM helix domain-containing protein n=1 Tax=Mycobacterium sp. smrl_JER01 TaxID=3402633 RepID=UPI003AC37E1B
MSLTETEESADPKPRRSDGRRSFFLRLHFYAGVFVGPFILVAALSGALYALAPSIEQIVYRDYLRTAEAASSLPVADQIRAAQQVRPDLTVVAVRPATEPGETTRVMFTDPALGPSQRHAVFVDPATGASRGELTVYGSSGALPMRTWISNLHRSLHLGDPGRIYSELAASWLWAIALGGIYLWISRYRRMKSREPSRARLLTVDHSAKGRRGTLGWHGALGFWMAGGLLFLSATGLTWSTYAGANISELRSALSWTTPTVSTLLSVDDTAPAPTSTDQHADDGGHAAHGDPAHSTATPAPAPPVDQVDLVLKSARAIGIDGKVEVGVPSEPGTAFTVMQTRQPWVLSNNSVAVDGTSGTITDVSWFADWPVAAKLTAWGIQLHMGLLFGLANQLALVALGAALSAVVVLGYVMWWRRRPTRGDRIAGRPPRRGVLAGLDPPVAVAVVLTAAAIGWFIPLLGVSLIAFVVVDVLVGAMKRRRVATEPASAR